MDCLFCKIVKGEIPCYKIYEDEQVLAFLDIKPATKGHCLIIPKEHAESIFDISEGSLQNVIKAAKKISKKIRDTLQAGGIRLSQSNGKAAGQEVMHFHLHIIPRYENDGLSNNSTQTLHLPQAGAQELSELAQKLHF